MPNLGATGLATIRKNRHAVRGWLTIFKGSTIVQATVSATPSAYPVSSIDITVDSGSAANIERGTEIIVTSSTGNPKGRLRVRMSGTINSTTLAVAEVSQATVTLVAGDILYILNEHRIRPKFPAADETFAPDLLTYTDQNSAVPPLAISGGPVCQWVDFGETYATIDFDGSESYVVDPDGGSITHAWTFPAGSTPASSTSATPTGVQIPVGEHWIKHTVTAGGKAWSQFIPVRVHDEDNLPYEVLVDSLSGTLQEGWTASFNLFESLGQDVAPDGALVVFWVQEIMDQEIQSLGSKGRSTSKFVGWLKNDEATSSATDKRLKLTAISAMARLGEIYGASKVMLSDTAPADWSAIDDLGVKLAIIQILRWYTTLTEVCDLFFDITDYTYPRFYEQKNTPLEMARSLADGVDARIACDRNGRVEVQLRPELTPRADRNTITTTVTLSEQDILQLSIQRDHTIMVDMLECRGIRYDSDTPLFSRYPGKAPGEGTQNTVNDRLITANQTDLNKRCGLRGGWLDKVYVDLDGVKHIAPQLTLTLFGSYDVFDFYREWLILTLDDTTNWREVDLSAFRWMVQSITVEYLSGTATVTLQLQAETGAQNGVTHTPPAPPENQIPASNWTLPDFPPINSNVSFVVPTDNIVAVTEDGHLFQTTNFTASPPTWTDRDISASLSSTTVLAFAVDPRSPLYAGTGTNVNGWIVTDVGIDYVTNLFGATPSVANQYTFPSPTSSIGIGVDYTSEPGTYAIVIFAGPAPDNYRCAVFDGATWSDGESLDESTTFLGGYLGISIDPHSAGLTYVFRQPNRDLMFGSHGANWNYDDDPYVNISSGTTFGVFIYMPFALNPSRYIYYNNSSNGLQRGDLAHDTTLTITPVYLGDNYGLSSVGGRPTVSSPSGNANRLFCVGNKSNNTALFLADNALDPDGPTWTLADGPFGVGVGDFPRYRCCAATDPDGEGAYLWGEKNSLGGVRSAIGFWDGTQVLDKRGTTFSASVIIGIAGG